MINKTKSKYQKRKLDRDTELIRMWRVKKGSEEEKEIKKEFKDAIKIDYKGMKLQISGFNTMHDKKTNKLVFAYKFKHDEKFVLYYVPDNNKEGTRCLELLKMLLKIKGYGLQNMEEQLKLIYAEYGEKFKNDKKSKK